ncbi:MAG: LysM peptidoglycan-binding domain-containing protein [Smithella sp.]|jgi:LysM repeat protein
MRKTLWWTVTIFILSGALFYSQALAQTEDTARLTFSKTAVSKKPAHAYTVQEGDVLSEIINNLPGVTRKNISNYYKATRDLNPNITDSNKLYVGQKILLPGESALKASKKTIPAGSQTYRVKKGDTLTHIIRRDLRTKSGSQTQKVLLLIKSLNPEIHDVNRIYIGQIVRLPGGKMLTASGRMPEVSLESEEPEVKEVEKVAETETVALPPPARLQVVKHVITQMKGTLTTAGNYYLPVSGTEQITIDCSVIPVVELDNQTIFLDTGNRSIDHLKKMIRGYWSNYHLIRIDARDDVITTLKKIFNKTRKYEIVKSHKPVSAGTRPSLNVVVDWIISARGTKTSTSTIQGLRFVDANSNLLPRALVKYAAGHSLILTEISSGKGLAEKPEEIYSLPPKTLLPRSSVRDFSHALLASLNIQAEKDVDVKVFDIQRDGYNLSIKADVAATHGGKKYLIFSRNVSPEFINMLQKSGNQLIFVSERDEPSKNMEKILRGFNINFTSGNFTFSGLEKNQPPYTLGFSGTRIKTDKELYVVNFDFNNDLRGLMQETWSAGIIQY